jgi:hypothetical protein
VFLSKTAYFKAESSAQTTFSFSPLDITLPAKVGAHLVSQGKTAKFSSLEVAICMLCICSVLE